MTSCPDLHYLSLDCLRLVILCRSPEASQGCVLLLELLKVMLASRLCLSSRQSVMRCGGAYRGQKPKAVSSTWPNQLVHHSTLECRDNKGLGCCCSVSAHDQRPCRPENAARPNSACQCSCGQNGSRYAPSCRQSLGLLFRRKFSCPRSNSSQDRNSSRMDTNQAVSNTSGNLQRSCISQLCCLPCIWALTGMTIPELK